MTLTDTTPPRLQDDDATWLADDRDLVRRNDRHGDYLIFVCPSGEGIQLL